MKIVWIGCHEEGVPAFKETLEENKRVVAFITLDANAFSRRSAGSREYQIYCEKYQVPYYTVDTIKGEAAYDIIRRQQPDLMVVLGWSEILPERLLEIPTIGTIGTHAALLPHNKGSAPVNWALIKGEKVTGNTMMWLSAEVDSGEIIDQMEIPITPYDTCKTIYDQVAATNAVMLKKLIRRLEQGIRPVLNIKNESNEPVLPRRRPKDGLIEWKRSGEEIYDFIRALADPYPGAFSFLGGKKWIIRKASLLPMAIGGQPGEIGGTACGFAENSCGYLIGTKTNAVLLTELEDEQGVRYAGRELNELSLQGRFVSE